MFIFSITISRGTPVEKPCYSLIKSLSAWSSRFRPEGAMLMLTQVDRALLTEEESSKHLECRLRGSAVSDLSKTSGMYTKPFFNILYHFTLSQSIYLFSLFLTVYPCFGFKKYTDTSEYLFRALGTVKQMKIWHLKTGLHKNTSNLFKQCDKDLYSFSSTCILRNTSLFIGRTNCDKSCFTEFTADCVPFVRHKTVFAWSQLRSVDLGA
jgi:hypothetical protein